MEKAKLSSSTHQIEIFLKSAILIYHSEVPGTASRKSKRTQTNANPYAFCTKALRKRRTQPIAKRFAFHENSALTLHMVSVAGDANYIDFK